MDEETEPSEEAKFANAYGMWEQNPIKASHCQGFYIYTYIQHFLNIRVIIRLLIKSDTKPAKLKWLLDSLFTVSNKLEPLSKPRPKQGQT